MQARHPDHGDPLQKAPKLPWGTRTKKTHLMPKGPQQCQRGPPPWQKSNLQRSHPWRLVEAPSATPLPPYPATSHPWHRLIGLYPLQLIPGGERAHIPFRLSEFKEIRKDLGNYTENPDQYIQGLREVSQNFELSWKDVMLLLSQTLTSLEKQWVLDQAAEAGVDYHLDKCGPIGLAQTRPPQEGEKREGKERQRHRRLGSA
jgi:hypothetical protein